VRGKPGSPFRSLRTLCLLPLLLTLVALVLLQGCVIPLFNSGPSGVELKNNSSASDPTWDELMAFLAADPTDEFAYIKNYRECTDFAESLHNNAESQGIRAGYVEVWFVDSDIGHALNVFDTTDKGRVFVDCTGPSSGYVIPGSSDGEDEISCDHDKIAYVEEDKDYGLISISAAESPDYKFYEEFLTRWQEYENALQEYESDVAAYEALYDSCHGIASPGKCSTLPAMYDELESQRAHLDAVLEDLGYCFWPTSGTVSKITIYW
jgi:hypothetical protein